MANQQKPLTYLSLKCVLQYCTADLRILLPQHFPFIHRIEKSIPLKIEKLHLEPFLVRINDTEYRLKTIRKFPNSRPFGSFQCDLDEYGVPDRHEDYELTPGDVQIEHGGEKPHLIEDQTLETLEFIMTQLTRRDMLRWDDPLLNPKSKFATPELVDPYYCDIQLSDYVWIKDDLDYGLRSIEKYQESNTSGNSKFVELGVSSVCIRGDIRKIDKYFSNSEQLIYILHRSLTRIQRISLIEQLQCHILPLQYRQHNMKPFFKCYLQLTTVTQMGKTIEILKYNRNIHVAMKYLNERLFGSRGVIYVKQLGVGNDGGVLKLPYSLKLKISHLKMQKNWKSAIDRFQPVLEASSFPLKSVESQCWRMYNLNHNYKIIHEATKLYCPDLPTSCIWEYSLVELKNLQLHLRKGFDSADKVMTFLHWFVFVGLKLNQCGAVVTAGVMDHQFASNLYSLLLQRPSTRPTRMAGVLLTPSFPHCFTIPLTDQTELNVFGLDTTKEYEEDKPLWILTMEVMKIDSASPIEYRKNCN